jgi:hypothetical protein
LKVAMFFSRRLARMRVGRDGVLLGRQPEGVPAHGVEDVDPRMRE